jgi:hypothetical protein
MESRNGIGAAARAREAETQIEVQTQAQAQTSEQSGAEETKAAREALNRRSSCEVSLPTGRAEARAMRMRFRVRQAAEGLPRTNDSLYSSRLTIPVARWL